MILFLFIFYSLTSVQGSEWNQNQFNQLCNIKNEIEFEKELNQFQKEYSTQCGSGYYYGVNNDGVVDCYQCTKGFYIRNQYICCECSNGSISTQDNAEKCELCPQKYGANKNHTECELCPIGTYSNAEGSGCISCGIGKYTIHEGSSYCIDCPIGYGVNKEGNGCEICKPGYYSDKDGSGCIKCNLSSISTTGLYMSSSLFSLARKAFLASAYLEPKSLESFCF